MRKIIRYKERILQLFAVAIVIILAIIGVVNVDAGGLRVRSLNL